MAKREPLLTHHAVHAATNGEPFMRAGMMYAIDFYERLISEGKLRKVEAVDPVPEWIDGFKYWNCPICKSSIEPEVCGYCPHCGTEINEP